MGIRPLDFDLNQEQALLKATVDRFVDDCYAGDRRRAYLAEETGFGRENWRLLGELGLIAAAFSERRGGLGSSLTDVAVIFEALGRGNIVEPLLESAFVAGGLFDRLAPDRLAAEWAGDLVSGKKRLALAHREKAARKNSRHVACRAERNGVGWILNGEKSVVAGGWGADGYLISVRVSGEPADDAGVMWFLAAADEKGIEARPYRLIDGTSVCTLSLDNVKLANDRILGEGFDAFDEVSARADVAQAAEAVGLMDAVFASTLDYLRTRKQFGAPLGSFQAIQHRMVALYAKLEQSRSLLYAALTANADEPAAPRKLIAGMRAFVAEAALELGHEAIQLHGGMGVSDELMIGHAHKRLVKFSRFPIDAETALDRFAGA